MNHNEITSFQSKEGLNSDYSAIATQIKVVQLKKFASTATTTILLQPVPIQMFNLKFKY